MARHRAVVGADRVVHAADPDPAAAAGSRDAAAARRWHRWPPARPLALMPLLGLPAFYDSLLYLVFHWIVLATSWNLLSGYAGYFSFGHGAFFGAGALHDRDARRQARLAVPCHAAGRRAGSRAAGRGARRGRVPRASACAASCSRCSRWRVTFVLATIVLNTPHRRRPGHLPERGPVPSIAPTHSGDVLSAGACSRPGTCSSPGRLRSKLRPRPLRDPRRRGRGRSDGRADLRLQARGVRRSRARSPALPAASTALHLVRDGRRGVLDHRAADRRPDERARRHAALGRPRRRRDGDHGAAVLLHRRRSRGARQGRHRRDPHRRDPVHAATASSAARSARRGATPLAAPHRPATSHARRRACEPSRPRRRAGAAGPPPCCCARATSASRSRACARSPASTSRCAAARSWACSVRTARASPRSSTSSAGITRRQRRGRCSRAAAHGPARAPHRARGHRAHLPDPAAVPRT